MNIIEGIGGLVASMNKKNNENNTHISRPVANTLSKSAKSSMLTRIISAIVIVLVMVPSIFLGDWIYFGLITILLGIACWEILGCTRKRTFIVFLIYFMFVACIAYWPLFKTVAVNGTTLDRIDNYFNGIYLSILIIAIGVFLMFSLTVLYKDFTVQDATFLITMGILIGLGFQCLFYLRFIPNSVFGLTNLKSWVYTFDNTVKTSLLLLFVFLATVLTDVGAYFVGVFFGKHKMNERVSPKKTWEGFFGGIVISFLLSSSIALIFAACGYPILPMFDVQHFYYILILSFLIPLFATLGDFVFSSIKRFWGIKDYGKLIPGHGGVLDRLDSVFFAAIISAVIVFMFLSIENGFDWAKFLV